METADKQQRPRLVCWLASMSLSASSQLTTYEPKNPPPELRTPMITCPTVPNVPLSLLDAYSHMPRLVLEEYFPAVWQETDDDRRSWYIAHFDLLHEIRAGLFKLALIIKFFKRPLEKYLSPIECDKVFLTVEALFWYHLDFYQDLVQGVAKNKTKSISTDLRHFIEASGLDHAILFTEYPCNIDYFDAILSDRPELIPHYETCKERLLKSSGLAASLSDLIGSCCRRFQMMKSQVATLVEFGPQNDEREALHQCKFLLDSFEVACGKIFESRVDMINLFNAFCKADYSKVSSSDKKVFAPLDVGIDRRDNLKETFKQMQNNAKVRYNQAIYMVDYAPAKPGKPLKWTVSKKQVSISLFSRHMALLEIVFPRGRFFRKQKKDVWTYRMMCPLIPLDKVTLHLLPDTEKERDLVEIRLAEPIDDRKILYVKCEDAKHRKDLLQQFRLISMEACPTNKPVYPWRYQSAAKVTPSEGEMLTCEASNNCASFDTSMLGSGSLPQKPTGLIRLTEASTTTEQEYEAIDSAPFSQAICA